MAAVYVCFAYPFGPTTPVISSLSVFFPFFFYFTERFYYFRNTKFASTMWRFIQSFKSHGDILGNLRWFSLHVFYRYANHFAVCHGSQMFLSIIFVSERCSLWCVASNGYFTGEKLEEINLSSDILCDIDTNNKLDWIVSENFQS